MKNKSPPLTDQTIVSAVSDQLTCELAGDAAILKISDGVYYGLNETGAFLWEKMQNPICVEHLHVAMLQAFDIAPEVALRDLTALLEEMLEARLIETRDAVAS